MGFGHRYMDASLERMGISTGLAGANSAGSTFAASISLIVASSSNFSGYAAVLSNAEMSKSGPLVHITIPSWHVIIETLIYMTRGEDLCCPWYHP